MSEFVVVINQDAPIPVYVSGASDVAGPTGPTGPAMEIASRSALAALTSPAAGQSRYLAEAGREGLFVFDSSNLSAKVTADPNQGVYVPPSAASTGASGAWVRKFSGSLDVRWFGAVADDPGTGAFGTDAYSAIAATFRLAEANAIAGYVNGTFYRGGSSVLIPKGGYYCSASLAPLFTGILRGEGGKGWGAATRIRFAAGVDGLQLQAHNTSGKTTLDGTTHFAGDRLHVCDISFLGAYSGTESDTHGVRGKRAGTIERCTFDGFEGDGLYCNTTFGSGVGSTEGNVNTMRVIDCDFQNNRRGRYCEGDDANAVTFIGCSYINNRQAGIDEEGFLGNHEFGPHIDGNARTADNAGTAAKPASYAYSSGHVHFVIRGQEAGAATNAPPATATDNTWWGYAWDQGAASPTTGVPAYAGSMTWRAGGPVMHEGASNSSSVTGAHIESNGVSQIDQGMVMLGTLGQVVRVSSGTLFRNRASTILSSSEGLVLGGKVAIRGDLSAGSPSNVIGPYLGATVQDGTTFLATRNTGHTISFQVFDASGNPSGAAAASLIFGTGFGASFDMTGAANFWRFKVGGNERFKVDDTGAIIDSAKALFVGPNAVVKARKTGWAVDTGTAKRTANATYVGGTANATYLQAEITAIRNALQDVSQTVKALKDDLHATAGHGLIGA